MASGFGTTRTKYYALAGGLDVVTPALAVPPGRCLAMVNFEPFYSGGYRRCDGFERYDGRPAPSDATYTSFDVDDATYFVAGDLISDTTSGATGVVIAVDGNTVAVTKVVGTFTVGDTVNGSLTITSLPTVRGAPDNDTDDEWLLAAQDEYRADIDVVPGTGPVLGVWRRNATVYAIRADDDSTGRALLHKASASGWTESGITMAKYVYFDGGGGGTAQALPAEGATINGQTSGATATVHRVVEHGGATGTNDSYGYLVLTSVTGTFQNNENLRVSTTKFADSASASAAFVLPGTGTYRFINHNFFGSSSTYRTYGVNGVGPAFEIDENHVVSPLLLPLVLETGQPSASDMPFLIEEHRNYLFLAYPGGAIVHSVVGEPLTINGFLGSAEFGMGAEITGMQSVVGNVLVLTTDRFTKGLYGSDISDWDLKLIGEKSGGKLYTVQQLDTVYTLDDLGVTSMARVQSFGDFVGSTISQLIQPVINSLRGQVTDSTIVRGSNQYRLYFSDGSALVMYVPAVGQSNNAQETSVQFGYLSYPFAVDRIYNSEDENGIERTYFATDDADGLGYVYEDQIGPSFDGDIIAAYLRLPFNHVGTPAAKKRYRRADLGLSATKPIALKFVADLNYGAPTVSSGTTSLTSADVSEIDVFGGGGFWDVSNWDEFQWDGQNIATARANLTGSGENIGFLIYHESAIDDPFVLQDIILHYDIRRLQR